MERGRERGRERGERKRQPILEVARASANVDVAYAVVASISASDVVAAASFACCCWF
jgi:hypothetical protein